MEIGQQIGSYHIDALLDQGGMGEVYKASVTKTGEAVAIKVIRPDLAKQERFRKLFQREADAASRLRHAHIVQVREVLEQGQELYLVMDYIDGTNLRRYLRDAVRRRVALPIADVLMIGKRIAEALYHAHQQNILHRDVKPENVLLRGRLDAPLSELTPILSDFGLAKILSDDAQSLVTQQFVGTYVYMSPEKFNTKLGPTPPDHRADIFALGVVLYECLANGDLPYQPEPRTLQEAFQVYTQPNVAPVPLSSVVPGLPSVVNQLVMKCIMPNAAQRFQSAHELVAAIDGVRKQLKQLAPPAAPPAVRAQPPASPLKPDTMPEQPSPPAPLPEGEGRMPSSPPLVGAQYIAPLPPPPRPAPAAPPPASPPPSIPRNTRAAQSDISGSIRPSQALYDTLIVYEQNRQPRRVPIDRDVMTMGRGTENAVILNDSEASRVHAELSRNPKGGYLIKDNGSLNGTWLNDQRLQSQQAVPWLPGHKLRVGFTIVELEMVGVIPVSNTASTKVEKGTTRQYPLPEYQPTVGASAALPAGNLRATMTPDRMRVDVGGRAQIQIEISNERTSVEQLHLNLVDLPLPWYTLSQTHLRMMPGEKQVVTLSIHPPRASTSTAGAYTFTLRIMIPNTGENIRLKGHIDVAPYYSFTTTLQPTTLRWQDSTTLTIANTGNAADTYTLECRDDEQVLRFIREQDMVTVAPGKRVNVPLKVTPFVRPLFGMPQTHVFEITVTSEQEALPPQKAIGKRISGALLPGCAIAALLTFGLSICAAIIGAVVLFNNNSNTNATATAVQATNMAGALGTQGAVTQTAVFVIGGQTATQAVLTVTAQAIQITQTLGSTDSDGDGLSNTEEAGLGTNPNNPDSDGDGLSDRDERTYSTDPLSGDTDKDGLGDRQEVEGGTNPNNPDTDGDGVPDNLDPQPRATAAPPTATATPLPTLAPLTTATPTPIPTPIAP
ncbi:MAG: protein kinase [Chloroflexota bacterium]|nr:protein kinase [Chloroflexota bacterium]